MTYSSLKVTLVYVLGMIIEIVILASRTHFMLTEGSQYDPYELKSGDLVYMKRGSLLGIGQEARAVVGCPYDIDDAMPASDGVCSFASFEFNANLLTQGWVQCSLGLSLFISILFRIGIFAFKLSYDINSHEPNSYIVAILSGVSGWISVTIVVMLLHIQQFISLLPIELIRPNAYCLEIHVPVSTTTAICQYKIGAAVILIGFPVAIAGLVFAFILFSLRHPKASFAAIVSTMIGLCGLAMTLVWLFGGIVLGFWYVFADLHASESTLTLAALSTGVLALVFIDSLVQRIVYGDYMLAHEAAQRAFELSPIPVAGVDRK
jgi:hypothetical protein